MNRAGRPKVQNELEKTRSEIRAGQQKLKEQIRRLRNPKAPFPYVFKAASVLLTLELGSPYQKARCDARIIALKKLASKNGPPGPWPDSKLFLEAFIEKHAANWNWRAQITDDELSRQNEAIAQENARRARYEKAVRDRFTTADEPDLDILRDLSGGHFPIDLAATWPTLRRLKLATAMPERRVKKIIQSLVPRNGEVIVAGRAGGPNRRGACPKRIAPRLVIGVLNELIVETPRSSAVRKIAITAKRSLAARLAASRSGT